MFVVKRVGTKSQPGAPWYRYGILLMYHEKMPGL